MAGTTAGGKAAAKTLKKRYGHDFYVKLGVKGGKKGRTGGFYGNRKLASEMGARGGRNSSRAGKPNKPKKEKK